jgi:MoaA/NifB/PqqE/SkfB family radical SAM enzyme
MDVNVFTNTLASMGEQAPREIIPSTMGEPLLYRDIDFLIASCRKSGSRLNLTTNGTFPRRGARRWGQIILPLASDVKISMNGMTDAVQEGVMQGAKAACLRENLRTFVAVRDQIAATGSYSASITIQVTFMERNLAELPSIVRFALELGVDRVKGHHLWPHFEEIKADDLRRSPESRASWNQIADECAQIVEDHVLAGGYRLKLENFERLPQSDNSRQIPEDYECPFLGREAWVNHEGRFDPCCAPDEQRKSLGSFGFVADPGGLLGIWNSAAYRDLVKNYKRHPLCQTCVMRRPRKVGVS